MTLDPELTERLKRVLAALEPLLPPPAQRIDWATCHAANWHRSTFAGTMEPVPSIEAIHLDDLLGIEAQKKALEENTRQFLAGLPANNALLWGTRGTGKSSLVRALLHAYAGQGLRIIQVDKDDLASLPAVGEQDIIRSLQLLPGIQSASDISSGLYIRGGGPDQTLILLDQIPLYNPTHAFGFFPPGPVRPVIVISPTVRTPLGGRAASASPRFNPGSRASRRNDPAKVTSVRRTQEMQRQTSPA